MLKAEMQTSREDWHSFFRGAQIVLDATARADKLLKLHLGSGFNVFDWIESDENTLSDLLRDLLDPAGTHGQGSAFLKLALEHLIPTPDPIASDTLEQCVVVREALTSNGRLIDLVVDLGSCGIGIENKPFAAEQEAQLADYADHLGRQFDGRFCLVFLHGPGMRANSLGARRKEHLQAERRFLEVPYHAAGSISLHAWLTRCAAAVQSEKIRFFLTDFAAYVAREFVSPNGDNA